MPQEVYEERYRFEHEARACGEEADHIDRVVRRSIEKSELEDQVVDCLNSCVTHYNEFRMWEARVESCWNSDPAFYDEAIHEALGEIGDSWEEVFRDWVDIVDRFERSGLVIEQAPISNLRQIYATMLQVRVMDHAAMPTHLSDEAARAREAFERGEVESVGKGDEDNS